MNKKQKYNTNEEEYDFDKFTSDSSDDYPKYADGIIDKKENKMEQASDRLYEELLSTKRNKLEELKESIVSANERAMLVDGHDDALAGYDTKGRAVYLVDQILQTLINRDGMSRDEAMEFFDFNIADAYVGEFTPIYIYKE
jgi:hypothetical protein